MNSLRYILFLFLIVPLVAQNRLAPEEERGRQIFERGIGTSAQAIAASVAGEDTVAGFILPCSNCHGHDGQGKPEGGVVPSNITWDALTKPYGLTHPDGRTHPPYTEHLLKRAITMGVDPAGNVLNNAMPRFQLSLADASDLVAYMKRLGQVIDPGLTGTTVRLGVILPPSSGTARTSRIIRQTLLDYFASVNGTGGIFSRRIELTFTELPLGPAQRAGAVRDFLSREQIFAVVCGAFTGAEAEIGAVLRDTGTPAIGAFVAFPETGSPLNAYVFYLDGGVKEESNALLDFAVEQFPRKNLLAAIVSSNEEISREAAKWLQARLAEFGYSQVVMSEDLQPPLRANLIFWLRTDWPERSELADEDTRNPTVFLIPGSLAGAALLRPWSSNVQVLVALGTASPADNAMPDTNTAMRMAWDRTTASAEIIAEAMKRSGRSLTRTKLIEALEGFYRVEGSFHVPITFGPNRRVGASNVRILMVDPKSQKLIAVKNSSHGK